MYRCLKVYLFLLQRMLCDADVNPFKRCKHTGQRLVHWLPPIPIEPMKQVKKALGGVTVNDIVSTAVGRGVWRYMTNVYENDKYCDSFKGLPTPDKWTMSDFQGTSMWMSIPRKFGNKVGGARIWDPVPSFVSNRSGHFSPNEAILKEVKTRRNDIYIHMKKLKLPVAFQLACKVIPNNLPVFLANLLVQPPTTFTYLFSNIRSMPVKYLCMDCSMYKLVACPQLFASAGKFRKIC